MKRVRNLFPDKEFILSHEKLKVFGSMFRKSKRLHCNMEQGYLSNTPETKTRCQFFQGFWSVIGLQAGRAGILKPGDLLKVSLVVCLLQQGVVVVDSPESVVEVTVMSVEDGWSFEKEFGGHGKEFGLVMSTIWPEYGLSALYFFHFCLDQSLGEDAVKRVGLGPDVVKIDNVSKFVIRDIEAVATMPETGLQMLA